MRAHLHTEPTSFTEGLIYDDITPLHPRERGTMPKHPPKVKQRRALKGAWVNTWYQCPCQLPCSEGRGSNIFALTVLGIRQGLPEEVL